MNLKPLVFPAITVALSVFGWLIGWSIYDSSESAYSPATFQLILIAVIGAMMVVGFTFSYHKYQKDKVALLETEETPTPKLQAKKFSTETKQLMETQKEINRAFGQLEHSELNSPTWGEPEAPAENKSEKKSLESELEESRIKVGLAINRNLIRQLDTDKLLASPTRKLEKLGFGENIAIKIERSGKQLKLPVSQSHEEIPEELLRGADT